MTARSDALAADFAAETDDCIDSRPVRLEGGGDPPAQSDVSA